MGAKKILILSHKPPYSKNDGGCVAIAQVLERLTSIGHEVTLLTMETHKHPSPVNKHQNQLTYKSVFVDTRIRPMGALRNLFTSESYILSRFHQSAFDEALKEMLKSNAFDDVIFESLFTSSYYKTVLKFSKAKLMYRSHNIEHQIWENKSRFSSNPLTKTYLKLQAKRLKREEINFWNSIPKIASISNHDSKEITKQTKAKIETLPLYADEQLIMQKEQVAKVDFFHLGAMDWTPNQQAIEWLLNEVWPSLKEKEARAEFHLAGRGMTEKLAKRIQEGLYNHGEVSDALGFISDHKVMLVPLFVGSGIRVKIIEGMAMAKCIITTTKGAQGISCTHMENMLIANTKEEFIEMMSFCLHNPDEVDRMGENARHYVRENFSQEKVEQQLNTLLA